MLERISRQMVQPVSIPSAAAGQKTRQAQQEGGFGAALRDELARQQQTQQVAFSKHAIARAQERGIEVTPALMEQLSSSVERAQAKGATNILAMDAGRAFIINVPNAKVITAISQEELKENVFTNIDGAVFL